MLEHREQSLGSLYNGQSLTRMKTGERAGAGWRNVRACKRRVEYVPILAW